MQLDPEAVLSENEHVVAKLDTIAYSGLPGHADFDLNDGGSGKLVLTENSESGERLIYLVHNFQKRSIDFQERFDRDWVGNCCGEDGYPCCPRTPSSNLAQNYLVTRQDINTFNVICVNDQLLDVSTHSVGKTSFMKHYHADVVAVRLQYIDPSQQKTVDVIAVLAPGQSAPGLAKFVKKCKYTQATRQALGLRHGIAACEALNKEKLWRKILKSKMNKSGSATKAAAVVAAAASIPVLGSVLKMQLKIAKKMRKMLCGSNDDDEDDDEDDDGAEDEGAEDEGAEGEADEATSMLDTVGASVA
eukprot:g6612.t1